jgi:hypothetical protein
LDHSALGGHAEHWPFCREPSARLEPGPTDHSADRSAAPGVCRRPRNLASRLRLDRLRSWSCRTRSTVRRSSGQTRTRRSWRLSPTLSVRWGCARRHRRAWRNRSAWKPSVSLRAAWRTTSTHVPVDARVGIHAATPTAVSSQPSWLTVEQMHNNRKRYILEMGAQSGRCSN